MSDADRAQEQELAMYEINHRNARMAEYKPGEPGYGPALCRQDDCGEPISAARRAMGARCCVECTETQERLRKLQGR